ncbi:DUF1905 domain-containing protein [Lacisediminihabitans sp. FW035]
MTVGRPGSGELIEYPAGAEPSATILRTRYLVKVEGTIDGEPFRGAFMALDDGTHKLRVTAAIRKSIGKTDGDDDTVHLSHRIS